MFYKTTQKIYFTVLFASIATCSYANTNLTNDAIANLIIQESINNYSGRCPCPYTVMKNGKACGGKSAYSKPGGKSPLCYRADVTVEMIKVWRDRN